MTDRERVNILLVDDQPARLLSYSAILGGLGQNLMTAAAGVEALELLMKHEFAVVLLDVSMPVMDGFEVAAMIHQHPRFERTPIIFVTAFHVTDLDRLKGYELGAVDYVYVPIVPAILRSKVAVLVELHLKRRELQAVNAVLEQANAELALANSTLQAEKARELERLNATLEEANAELALANRSLQAEVAARERLETALRDADRRKDEFLAMLAHELRNPLAPIQNAVQLMDLSGVRDPQVVWCREVIERQLRQLTRLVEDLLDVSRITQGKINVRREPVDVSAVIARAIETSRPLIDARRHELTVEAPRRPLQVLGDLTRLAQVVGNLLNNAAKYTADGGHIRLDADRDGEDLVIRVRDDGVGIPAEMLPHVFDLFTQAERTIDRAQGGLGIGLALVRRLVETLGGTVTARSDGPGKGSEFVVRMPLLAGTAPRAETAPNRASDASGAAPRRVVVVADDNADAAASLAMLLRSAGNHVETAGDGIEAFAVAERIRPDVAFLDVGMPRLDGYGTAKRIRSEPWGRDMTLVAVTGWGQEETRTRARAAGFDAHLVKPVEFAAVTAILAGLTRPVVRVAAD
jgi:signal transduction histidine kinase